MCHTVDISEFDLKWLAGGRTYIARPVGPNAWSGQGITIIDGPSAYKEALALKTKYETMIASEYISNPLLYEGKKTHLRCFLLVSKFGASYKTWLFDFARLYHAKLSYKNADYGNKLIHDTHLKSTSRNIFVPRDLSDTDPLKTAITSAWPKIEDCMRHVSRIFEGYCQPYSNAENAFEIFGCDVMIADDGGVKLIEINEHTGLDLKPEPIKIEEFSTLYFERIYNMVILPHLGNSTMEVFKSLYSSS
jgi:hypothetical protein